MNSCNEYTLVRVHIKKHPLHLQTVAWRLDALPLKSKDDMFLNVTVYILWQAILFKAAYIASWRYSFDQSKHYLVIKLITFVLLAPLFTV